MKILAAIAAIAMALTVAAPASGQDTVIRKHSAYGSASVRRTHRRNGSYRRSYRRRAYVVRVRPRTSCSVSYRHRERVQTCRTVYRR